MRYNINSETANIALTKISYSDWKSGVIQYLDVSDELLCWRFNGNFAVYGSLYGVRPPHGLIQHFGVEAIGVLSPVHDYVPVTCSNGADFISDKLKGWENEV